MNCNAPVFQPLPKGDFSRFIEATTPVVQHDATLGDLLDRFSTQAAFGFKFLMKKRVLIYVPEISILSLRSPYFAPIEIEMPLSTLEGCLTPSAALKARSS